MIAVNRRFRVPIPQGLRVGLGLALLALGVAGCAGGGSAPQTFDLSAVSDVRGRGGGRGQIVVAEPLALALFDSERVVVRTGQGGITYLPGVQWADRLPRLVQTRLVQSFENARRLGSVGRPGDRLIAAFQLNTELRAFEIREEGREAYVEVSVKLVNDRTGRIAAGQVFQARAPVGNIDGPNATAALNAAATEVFRSIITWAAGRS